MREGVQTDHEFEPSPFCDCDDCNVFCHYHYGQEDACLLERNMHQEEKTYIILAGKAITCLLCGMTSHNINDVTNRYCGNCHIFHEDHLGQRGVETECTGT